MATKIYKPSEFLSQEEQDRIHAEIQAAKDKNMEYDEDCPELTPEMLKQLKVSARNRERARRINAQ